MHHPPNKLLLMLLFSLLFAGCSTAVRDSPARLSECNVEASISTAEPDKGDSAYVQLRAKLTAQSRQIDELQLQLLVKQAEIYQLQLSHDSAIQEAMRANARLRSLDSKADTIANVVEASLLIKNARETSGDKQLPALVRAEKLLDESQQALQAGNLDDASYLADRALDLVLPRTPVAESGQREHAWRSEAVFPVPLVMKVKKQSNIREKPTAHSSILFQLKKGTLIRALGYRRLWIKVVAENSGEGWIYYRLLEAGDITEQ